MPIYEYSCAACGADFDALLALAAATPPCPSCRSLAAERRMSRLAAVGCAPDAGGT